jgi:hypothetical protein
MEGIHR